jgi:L-lactate dehydrogenase complex protein LldF
MGLSLPPLFIAITGIEKAIGTLEDLAALLRLLARSATGQRASSYVNLLRPSQGDEDGPQEMHLVLLDNGRRRALADPALKEMLLCIRCGACLNICPVYQTVGGHAYGSVYPGPMGAILSNLLGEETEEHRELPYLSTLCGACREVCPVGIDLPRMLLELRARAPKPFKERMAARGWEWAMSRAPRMEAASKLMRIVGAILPGGLPGGWLESGERSFRDQVK